MSGAKVLRRFSVKNLALLTAIPTLYLFWCNASKVAEQPLYKFYLDYKNHVLVDCISGLPVDKLTTTADVADSTIALGPLSRTDQYLPLVEYIFIADKAYDFNAI